ncbi:uncharacterized protein B0I36DRAFT_348682 [Microdochium trichocladiopsis]|uniref:Uncharacterized protein n=1 Tax=Microdochium trichocladiopsis TaxID=1682393 RepID=A0A9P8Y9H6_9PEZI|nr:uncharacterized protein B0I36DRAFT_348682 [Microdochium trichocladiopsis]KAH7033649.1 hypothetical protein B0I36DRAFT_348682 [Microdochium trichocladiopsis]
MSQVAAQQPPKHPAEGGDKQTYMAWAKQKYGEQYEIWMPWIEDTFLKYFTKDNKASYATKEQLNKTKITGVKQIDNLQDGVHNLAAGTVGQGGILQPVGDLASKEGANRFERGGKDDKGSYIPGVGGRDAQKKDGGNGGLLGTGVSMPSVPSVPGFGGKK